MEQLPQVAAAALARAQATTAHGSAAPAATAESRAAAAPASSSAAPDPTTPRGMLLVDAVATLSAGHSMITDIVFGADNQVAQIRVIDPETHRVIAQTPPDTMARFEREVLAYQQVGREAKLR